MTDYGRPVRKSHSLSVQKSNPNSKFIGTAEAHFVCHIGPKISGFFELCLHWVSVVHETNQSKINVYLCKMTMWIFVKYWQRFSPLLNTLPFALSNKYTWTFFPLRNMHIQKCLLVFLSLLQQNLADFLSCSNPQNESSICFTNDLGYFLPFPVNLDVEVHLKDIIRIDQDLNSISVRLELWTKWIDPGLDLSNKKEWVITIHTVLDPFSIEG